MVNALWAQSSRTILASFFFFFFFFFFLSFFPPSFPFSILSGGVAKNTALLFFLGTILGLGMLPPERVAEWSSHNHNHHPISVCCFTITTPEP